MNTTDKVLQFAAHVEEPVNENALIDSAIENIRKARREANQAAGWFFDDIFRTLLPKCEGQPDGFAEIKRNLKAAGLHDVTLKLFFDSFSYASRSLESINRLRRGHGQKALTMSEWVTIEKNIRYKHYFYD